MRTTVVLAVAAAVAALAGGCGAVDVEDRAVLRGRVTPLQVQQLAAAVASELSERSEQTRSEITLPAVEHAAEHAEESTELSAELSAEHAEHAEHAEESSESTAPKRSVQQLQADLATLLLKKDSGKYHGDDLAKLNVEIELALSEIKAAQQQDTGKGTAPPPPERTPLEEVMDPILAHLATLKRHREFAGLVEIDLRDLQSNMERLDAMINDYLGGGCGSSCPTAPAPAASCGSSCAPRQLVEAQEVKCGSSCVVANNGCSTTTTCGPMVPTIVQACNADAGACSAVSKSAITTCEMCAQQRDECHATCVRWETPSCANTCATQTQNCHSTCVAQVVPSGSLSHIHETQVNEVCGPGNGGRCPGVVPSTVPKGTLSDHGSAHFFF